MKKLIATALLASVMSAAALPAAGEESFYKLSSDADIVMPGGELMISFDIEDAYAIKGIQCVIEYDGDRYIVSGSNQGTAFDNAMASSINTKKRGEIQIMAVYTEAYTIEGNVCTVNFKAKQGAYGGETEFKLTNVIAVAADDREINGADATVKVQLDGPPEPTEKPKPIVTNQPTASPEVSITPVPELATAAPTETVKPSSGGDAAEAIPSPTEKPTDPANSSRPSSGGGVIKATPEPTVMPTDEPVESTVEPLKKENIFLDIDSHWAKNDIEELYELRIINGTTETSFEPEKDITRAEFVKIVVGALGLEKQSTSEFADVKNTDWFNEYIGAAVSADIIQGDNGTFRPNDKITRQEMCVVIDRAFGSKLESNSNLTFNDESLIAAWAAGSVKRLASSEIVNGMDDNMFNPLGSTTRAQAAVVLNRVLKRI